MKQVESGMHGYPHIILLVYLEAHCTFLIYTKLHIKKKEVTILLMLCLFRRIFLAKKNFSEK
jgi:hypothetical protein